MTEVQAVVSFATVIDSAKRGLQRAPEKGPFLCRNATPLDSAGELRSRVFDRSVARSEHLPGRGTAAFLGDVLRDARPVEVEGRQLFFRDLPSAEAQQRITRKLGHPQGRVFTEDEVRQILEASAVNQPINDELLKALQGAYDDHDPRRMAGAVLLGALGSGALALLLGGGNSNQEVAA